MIEVIVILALVILVLLCVGGAVYFSPNPGRGPAKETPPPVPAPDFAAGARWRVKGPGAESNPLQWEPQPERPRDIGPGRLTHLIFRSHAVFFQDVSEWTGTAAELIERLSGSDSALVVLEEWRELPEPGVLGRRLGVMSKASGHYLRIEQVGEDRAGAPIFRLSLNPMVPRAQS